MKKRNLISSIFSLCMTTLLFISCVVAWYCVNITSNVSGVVGSSEEDKNYNYELYYYTGSTWQIINSSLSSFIPLDPGEKIYFKLVINSDSNEESIMKCKFEDINTSVNDNIIYNEYTMVTANNYNVYDSELDYYSYTNGVYTFERVAPFTTDGLLSTKSGDIFTPVTSGEYNSTADYYFTDDYYGSGYTHNKANIFTTDGSLYVNREAFFIEIDEQIYHLYDATDDKCPWTFNSEDSTILAKESISNVMEYSNVAFTTTELEYEDIVNSHMEYTLANITESTFLTDGSLYTLVDGIYTSVTSGTFDEATDYYTVLTRSIDSDDLFNNQVVVSAKDTYYLYFTLEYLDLNDNNPYLFQTISVSKLAIEH